MNVRETVANAIRDVATQQGHTQVPQEIFDETELMDFRLDSLGFANLLTQLEETLGYDPFSMADEPAYPRTFGDLVAIYENYQNKAKAE